MKKYLMAALLSVGAFASIPAAAQATTMSDPALIAANIQYNAASTYGFTTWEEVGYDLRDIYNYSHATWNQYYGPTCGNGAGPSLHRADSWATPSPGKVIPRNLFGSAYGCAILIQSTTFWPDYQYALQYGGSTDWTWSRTWHNANWYRRMMCRLIFHEMGHTAGANHSSDAFGDSMRGYITQQHTPGYCLSRWP